MGLNWIILQVLIASYSVVSPNPLYQMAAKMPQDDSIYINASTLCDLNTDGVPEVCLAASGGWKYYVYYYLDGEVYSVEDLEPWAWSSDLRFAEDGRLVMCAFSHTTGTAGVCQYRIYEWTSSGYHLAEDLWRMPVEWDEESEEPVGFEYISSSKAIDLFLMEDYSALLIPQEEYEQKITGLGEMISIFDSDQDASYREWMEWGGLEIDVDMNEIYGEIQKQILNWQS